MSEKTPQTLENHARMVAGYHYVLTVLLLASAVGAVAQLVRAVMRGNGRLDAAVLVLLAVSGMLLMWYSRIFPLKAQDRAIRAEENLRHYVLTGSLLDSRLRVRQIVALRFAPDDEVVDLARRAAEEGLSPGEIKKSIRTWKPDTYRV